MQTFLILLAIAAVVVAIPLSSHDLRRRLFATIYDRVTKRHEAWLSARKGPLLKAMRGRVLEIGPGTGANLGYFDQDIEWIGLEPNPHMHATLLEKADAVGLRCDLRLMDAGGMEIEDDAMDHVVSTLVLCSVSDPLATLREIRRVLKPSGSFVFLEHVGAPLGSKVRRWQTRVRPVWSCLADGCCPDRDLARMIREVGFAKVELEEFQAPSSIAPAIVGPHIIGQAYK